MTSSNRSISAGVCSFLAGLLLLLSLPGHAHAASTEVELTARVTEQELMNMGGCNVQYIGLTDVTGPAGYTFASLLEGVAFLSGSYCLTDQNLMSWAVPADGRSLVTLASIGSMDGRVRVRGVLTPGGSYVTGIAINSLVPDRMITFKMDPPSALTFSDPNYAFTIRHTTTDDISAYLGFPILRRFQIGAAAELSSLGYGTLDSQTLSLQINYRVSEYQNLIAKYPDGKVPLRMEFLMGSQPGNFDISQMTTLSVETATLDLCTAPGLCQKKQGPRLALGASHACAISAQNTVKCWGDNYQSQLGYSPYGYISSTPSYSRTPLDVTGLSDVVAITAGAYHNCALTSAGIVRCWGINQVGQLGLGVTSGYVPPLQQVVGLTGIKAITAGYSHTCAITAQDTVKCWGYNAHYELGSYLVGNLSKTPVDVLNLGPVKAISAGSYHTCAIKMDDTVKCWGWDIEGQLGNGYLINSGYLPTAVAGLTGVKAIEAGSFFNCALVDGGILKCWGRSANGELGNILVNNVLVPQQLPGVTNVKSVSLGGNHGCVITTGGTTQCWGDGWYGQLGNGTYTGSRAPVTVLGLTNPKEIGTGAADSCAFDATDTLKCWGRMFGTVPTQVSGF